MRSALAVVLAGALLACTAPPWRQASSSSGGSAAGFAVLGFGNAAPGQAHQDRPDGTSVKVVLGPQGGYHVWASVRLNAPVPQGVRAEFVMDAAGRPVCRFERRNLPLMEVASGEYEASGLTMILNDGEDPTTWPAATPLTVTARFTDSTGRSAEVERHWSATCCE